MKDLMKINFIVQKKISSNIDEVYLESIHLIEINKDTIKKSKSLIELKKEK